jgi:hypothetical protein
MSEHAIILDADFTRDLTDKEVEFLVKEFTELLRDKRKHKVKIINDIWTRVTPKESGG